MFRRAIEKNLLEALNYMPITLLRGARQTGKTTLMKEISQFKNYRYLTFDHLPSLISAKNDRGRIYFPIRKTGNFRRNSTGP